MHRLLCPRVRLFLCVLTLTMIVLPTFGQGTMGLLPGPMSSRDVDRYALRLGLSPQQRRSLDALHDQYKQEMRALREGEIAEFLKKMRDMEGSAIPQRKAVEDFVDRLDGLTRKIAAIDNRVFDQMQTVLTEEQLAMLPRVRQARARERMNASQVVWMGGERPVDLSEIMLDLDLTADERRSADAVLAPYESKLTADMTKMQDSQFQRILDMFKSMEELGLTETDMENPEHAEKIGEAMQQIWQEMMAKSMERAAAMAEHNDRTFASIAATLEAENARDLRRAYFLRAYPETSVALADGEGVFEPALRRDDLTDAQREAVIAARDSLRRSLDSIADTLIAQSQEFRTSFSPFEYDAQKAEAYHKSQTELAAKANAARATADAALEAALGKELHERIGRVTASTDAHAEAMASGAPEDFGEVDAEGDAEEAAEAEAQIVWGVDQFVPAAISDGEIAEYAQRLVLSDEQRTVMRDLHQRYTESFATINEEEFARLQKATTTLWTYDEAAQTSTPPTEAAISETYRLRAAALDAVKAADEAFFAEMELAILAPEQAALLPRIKAARDRVVHNRGAHYWFGNDSNEASIDLSSFVHKRRATFTDDQWKAVNEALRAYEDALGPLVRDRYARSLDAQKVQELWSAEISRAQAEGETNNVKLGMRFQELMREPQRALADATAALASLNRSTLDALMAIVPSDTAAALRSQYNLRAFPNVYADQAALDKTLGRARGLGGLTEEQSRRLADLAAEYQPAYAALCDQMIKASEGAERIAWVTMDEESVEEWQKREETLARLRFDRSELNARAARTLGDILSEDQLQAVGGLPVGQEDDDFDW